MDTPTVPSIKRCSKKENCIHPHQAEGGYLPATLEFFYPSKQSNDGLFCYCRKCAYAYKKKWRADNPDKFKAEMQNWHDANVEYERQYRSDRKDKIAENVRNWRVSHPYEYSLQGKRYRSKHPDIVKIRVGNWRRQHPDSVRAHGNKRRALKRGNGGSYTAADVALQIRGQTDKRGQLRCWWGGEVIMGGYHIDHVIPLDKGGRNDAANIVISCPKHNMEKSNKLPGEFNGRLL
jgi:5-methylcytosine-specific restriction endonuclease McrA